MVSALRATRAAGDAATQPPVEPPVEPPVIDLHDVHKVYGQGAAAVHAVRGITLRVDRGDYVALMGASGSGKSTLMHIVGCLDVPSSGRYLLEGIDVGELDESQLALARNRKVGFVFQSFNLLPRITTVQNVELPLAYAGVRRPERRRRALAALEVVGLREVADRTPRTLSGGQQQRAAVARAIVTSPSLLLADEPTGNLDSEATRELLAVLDRSHADGGTIVVVTHEREVAEHARRVVTIRDGRVIHDRVQTPSGSPASSTDEAVDR
jgi:putative ABC transport system ATP-binding protein